MFVRYKTHSNATLTDVKNDIISILSGNITVANDFSAVCQKSNTTVIGTLPANVYSVANSSTMTFAKNHNDYANTTHYFRLQFSSNFWVSTVLARSYDSGTDTLVNGVQYPTSNTNTGFAGEITLDIIAGEKVFYISGSSVTSKQTAILDIGKTGITRVFTNSMLMCVISDMYSGNNTTVGSACIPYTYNLVADGYSAIANLYFETITPGKQGIANGSLFAVENPCMIYKQETANGMQYIYGMQTPSLVPYKPGAIYSDNTGSYRYFYGNYSLIVD